MQKPLAGLNGELWTRNFIFLILTNGLFFSGFHILLPTIPLYAAQQGGSSIQVGLIAGIFVFSAIFIRLFTDYGKNKFGKKNCLFIGIVISFLSAASYLIWNSVGELLAIRVIHGLGFGIATTFYATIAADVIPTSRRGEGMGYFGLGTTVAMAIAPALGIWLLNEYGFSAVFVVAVLCQVIAFVWTHFCSIPTSTIAIDDIQKEEGRSLIDRFMERGTRFPALLTVLFGISYGSVLNFIAVFAKEVHIANPGYFFLVGTMCVCASRSVTGRIFDKKGPAWVILPGGILFFLSFVVLNITTSIEVFLGASVLYGLGVGALFPALQTWILNLVPANRRSAASATFYNVLDVGTGGGSIIFGMLAGKMGFSSVYIYSIAIMLVFILAYGYYIIVKKQAALETVDQTR